ncbi:MAG: hypothetical protein OEZ34_17465, partial [Spirochaetia bacterium]|nr:hypothetical protein [Spirochaetia bacterium]
MQILRESEGPNVMKPTSQTITCVPVRLIRSVLRHKADFQPSLFEHYEDSDGYYDTRHLPPEQINQFKNTFTGHEIELLSAILFRAGFEKSGKQYQWNRHAEFQSVYELCKIASGSKARSDKDITPYIKALKILDVHHWFLYKENEKVFLEKSRPINITDKNDGIIIEIAENIVRNPDYFKYIAISPSSLFKAGGIKRVSSAHIKLYMYLA